MAHIGVGELGFVAAAIEAIGLIVLVATSVSENAGGKPTTVHWNLRIGVSDVDGELLVSHLDLLR